MSIKTPSGCTDQTAKPLEIPTSTTPLKSDLIISVLRYESATVHSSSQKTRLTGRKIIMLHPAPSSSEELRENFTLAMEILDHVQRTILFSPNYPDRSDVIRNHYDDQNFLKTHIIALHTLLEEMRSMKADLNSSKLETYIQLASIAEKFNIGNCDEMAYVGLKYTIDASVIQRVEIFEIENGHHRFLVIGRNEGTDPADHTTWGPSAVICDPWASSCYPASLLKENLKDLSQNDLHTSGRLSTVVRSFDPSLQSLKSVVGNR